MTNNIFTRIFYLGIIAIRGMATMIDNQKENPYRELISAIEKYEEIEIWKEY